MEFSPLTINGIEAWDLFIRCDSQLRISPGGRVIGLDQTAIMAGCEMLGYDKTITFLLINSAEAGMLSGLGKSDNGD